MKNLKKYILSLTMFTATAFMSGAYANSKYTAVIDVYGTNQFTGSEIQNKYSHEIQVLADSMLTPHKIGVEIKSDTFSNAYMALISGVKAKGKFAYVSLDSIVYPNEPNKVYITINVVDEKERSRLTAFLNQPTTNNYHDPDGVIRLWDDYSNEQFNHFFMTKKISEAKQCPVYHCISGFEGKYAKYLPLFNSKVQKNKETLVSILADDKNESHRASAAFLLAHIKDGNELIRVLTPAMRDSNSVVRNNAMRVLGQTLEKLNTADFPVEEAVAALNFPSETDRNKALYILHSLSQQKRYATYIAAHAGDLLMANLKMTQPNLHDTSYLVLKRISGEKFGERDYASWQSWLEKHN